MLYSLENCLLLLNICIGAFSVLICGSGFEPHKLQVTWKLQDKINSFSIMKHNLNWLMPVKIVYKHGDLKKENDNFSSMKNNFKLINAS